METYTLHTEPAKLTIFTLEDSQVSELYNQIINNQISLYIASQRTRIESDQIELSAYGNLFAFNETLTLSNGEPESVAPGTIIIMNQGGEACVLDPNWIAGTDNLDTLFEKLSPREIKSYIHPRVLQNVIISNFTE